MRGTTWGNPNDEGVGGMFFLLEKGFDHTIFVFCGGEGTAWDDPNGGGFGQMFFVGGDI